MQYYSEVTKQLYQSVEELEKAETERKAKDEAKRIAEEKKTAERKEMAQKVEEARMAYTEAKEEYNKVLAEFCERYGYYHTSIGKCDLDSIFKNWFDFI